MMNGWMDGWMIVLSLDYIYIYGNSNVSVCTTGIEYRVSSIEYGTDVNFEFQKIEV